MDLKCTSKCISENGSKTILQRKITVTFSFPIFSINLVILEIIKAFCYAVSLYNLRNIGPTKVAESEGCAYIHEHFF
jgi:hypothetical protein